MPTTRGIAITLLPQFAPVTVPEYVDPADLKVRSMGALTTIVARDGGNEPVVTVHVPTYQSTKFCVLYMIAGPHENDSMFYFKLFVDGKHAVSWGCSKEDSFRDNVMFDLLDPVSQNVTGEASPSIMDTGNHVLEILVFRAKGRRNIQTFVQPSMGWGNHPSPAGHGDYYQYALIDPKDRPFAMFRYFFQSRDQIEQRHSVYVRNDPSPTIGRERTGYVQPKDLAMGNAGTSPMAFAYEYFKHVAGLRGSNDPFLTTAGTTPLALSPPVVIVDDADIQDAKVLPADIPTATSSVYIRDVGPSPSQSMYTDGPFCLGSPKVDKPNSPVPAGNNNETIPTVIVTPPAVDDVPELLQELPSGGIIATRFVVLKAAPTSKEYREAKARKVAKQMPKMQLLGADKVRRPARSDIAGCREIYDSPLPFRAYQDEYNRELLTKRLNKIGNTTTNNNNDNVHSHSHIRSDSSSTENSENPSMTSSEATTMITSPALSYDDDEPLFEGVELSDTHKNVIIHNTWSADADIPLDPLHDPAYLEARRDMMAHMRALAVAEKDNMNIAFCSNSSVVDDVSLTTTTASSIVSPAGDVRSPRREHGKAMMSLLQRRIERIDSRAGAANVNPNRDVVMYH